MATKRNPRTRKGRGIKTRNTVDRDVWCGAGNYAYCLDAPEDLPAGSTKQVRSGMLTMGPYLARSVALRPGWEWWA